MEYETLDEDNEDQAFQRSQVFPWLNAYAVDLFARILGPCMLWLWMASPHPGINSEYRAVVSLGLAWPSLSCFSFFFPARLRLALPALLLSIPREISYLASSVYYLSLSLSENKLYAMDVPVIHLCLFGWAWAITYWLLSLPGVFSCAWAHISLPFIFLV